ncbi:Os03g0122400, partial [Oryza sativa Japonica Group]
FLFPNENRGVTTAITTTTPTFQRGSEWSILFTSRVRSGPHISRSSFLSAHPSTGVHQGVSRIRGTHVEHGTTTSAGIPNSALCSPLAGSFWVGTLPLHANGGQRVEHTSMGTSYHSACARAGPHTAYIR